MNDAALPLTGVRVLDLADERAALAGRLLADLGAEVTLVEPPGGVRTRQLAPFVDDEAGPERSYQHLYFNANKRSVVLDLDAVEDAARLRALAAGADVLVETGHPDAMAERGLGYEDLRAENPGLIYVSVSPYGRRGPRRDWLATDLTASASGGLLQLMGEPEDPPTHGPASPAYTMSGLTAATGALVALHGRDHGGGRGGVHIDISMQEATSFAVVQTANPNVWLWRQEIPRRPALSQTMLCADGKWAGCNISPLRLDTFIPLLDAAGIEHGLTPDDWEVVHSRGQAVWQYLENPLQDLARELAAKLPREEFLQGLWDGGHAAMPTMDFPQIVESEHFRQADQFRDVDAPALGHPISFSRSPLDPVQSPLPIKAAPVLGERSLEEFPAPARPETAGANVAAPAMPLEGIRVVDFTWVLAGPLGTRMLANFGAEVIKVESAARMDSLRNQPLPGGRFDVNLGDQFNDANAGKKSVTLDLTEERGRDLVRQLITESDVVVNNYSAGALARMGFPYEELRKLNPKIVVLHLPGVGGDSPWASRRTLGNLLMAASGMNFLAGFPGRSPRGMGVAFPDFTSPHLLVTSVLAALRARDRTGVGREIELSQLSATVSLLGAEWMRFARMGEQAPLPGNRDPNYSPHGVYPTSGDDEWVAIAVDGDGQWSALVEVMGQPELADDPRFLDLARRRANEDALDELVARWTRGGDRWGLAAKLQAAGIAANPVEHLQDMMELDTGFTAHYQRVRQPTDPGWEIAIDGEPIRFAHEPDRLLDRAPMLGEHNEYVLRDVLGLSQTEFDTLVVEGVVH